VLKGAQQVPHSRRLRTRTANELPQRAAGYNAQRVVSARRRLVSRGGANDALSAGDGLASEALRLRCGNNGGRAAAKPAAAMRASLAQAGAHRVPQVPRRAHRCQRVRSRCRIPDGFAQRAVDELAQRASVIKHSTWSERVAESCGEAGRTLPARRAGDGLAGEAPRRRCAVSLCVPQPSQLQPRVRTGASSLRTGCRGCVQVRTGAHGGVRSRCRRDEREMMTWLQSNTREATLSTRREPHAQQQEIRSMMEENAVKSKDERVHRCIHRVRHRATGPSPCPARPRAYPSPLRVEAGCCCWGEEGV
jgi:hypothetical protein